MGNLLSFLCLFELHQYSYNCKARRDCHIQLHRSGQGKGDLRVSGEVAVLIQDDEHQGVQTLCRVNHQLLGETGAIHQAKLYS